MGKKVVTTEVEVKSAEETILKGSDSIYYNVNGILLSKNSSDSIILVIPDKPLLRALIQNKNLVEELDPSNPYNYMDLLKYGNDLDGDAWLEIKDLQTIYDGKSIEIEIKDHGYPIIVTKDLLPIKLKKDEFNNIKYRIFLDPLVCGLKKEFTSTNEGYGFTMMRLFKVI